MMQKINLWLTMHRGGFLELAVWAALYWAIALPMALGDTNGVGYFQQPHGHSLWAPLVLGGAVNIWIIYLHAFKAMPYLQQSGLRLRYFGAIALLLLVYLAAHLSYQLAIAWTSEPNLRRITTINWTIDNLTAAPAILVVSAIYKFGRDWITHTGEREALLQRTAALEDELRLMKQEVRDLQNGSANRVLKFQSSREKVQTPIDSIKYAKAAGNYVEIVTHRRTFTVYSSIKDLAAQLPADQFVRIHRSYVVNLKFITTLGGRRAEVGDTALPIGASYKKHLMSKWVADEDL